MSADNGIYILKTTDRWKRREDSPCWDRVDGGVTAYRVAHAQAIDNFSYYEKHDRMYLGAYMLDIWGKSKVFYNLQDALMEANRMANDIDILEYGISTIDASNYHFYQC